MPNNLPVNATAVLAYSKHLVTKTGEYLHAIDEKHGAEVAKIVALNFIASFIGSILHKTLATKMDGMLDARDQHDFVQANYADMKKQVQEAVGAGFTGAMKVFTGKDLDYYCQVKPVGDAVNKQPI